MGCSIDAWEATATSNEAGRRVVVVGDGTCTQDDYQLRLEPTNEGIVDDPEVIALRLIVTPPETGADVVTPAHVEYETAVDEAVNRVRIDTPDGSRWVEVRG